MPILDSSSFASSDTLPDFLRCDVCIIGTGPAGATIARELSNTSLRVTILESGGLVRQEEADTLNEIESVGWPRVMDQWLVRNRIVGGSSSTWTGRCAPFDEIDLQSREWLPYSGWPLRLEDLTPYLDRSAMYLGIDARNWSMDGQDQEDSRPRAWRCRPDPDKLLPMIWQYSQDSSNRYDRIRFGRGLDSQLGPNVTLITNATVLRINVNSSGAAVESVEFAAIDGRRWLLPVSTIVLCAGGIENARLLLSSDNEMSCGLGNGKGLVGRFLMDHPRTTVAKFPMEMAKTVLSEFPLFRPRTDNASLRHPGMRLSPTIQRSEQLLNCAIWVRDHRKPVSPREWLARFALGKFSIRQDLRTMSAQVALLAYDLRQHLISRQGLPGGELYAVTLDAMCEQCPNPESRLTLSDRRDHLGMRIPRIDWRVSEREARTLRRITELTVEHLTRIGVEPPALEDWVADEAMLPQTIKDAAHPTGTTRMADDPARGVVNSQCQVHGISGLFVGGSSVFPTSGHANPTQLIVALALRLADILKDRATNLGHDLVLFTLAMR